MTVPAAAGIVTPSATARWARALGWGAFAAGSVLRVIQLWLASRMGPDSVRFTLDIGVPTFVAAILLGTASGLVGAIIIARRPGNAIGWLYASTGLLQGVVSLGLAYAAVTLNTHPDAIGEIMAWANGVVDYAIPFSFAALVLALFPEGRLVGPRWRIAVALALVGGALRILEVGFGEPSMVLVADSVNPFRLGGLGGQVLAASSDLGVGSLLVEAAFVLAAISLGVRYRGSSLDGRRQILWLLLAGFVALLSTVPLVFETLVPGALPTGFDALAVMFAALCLAPIATLVAISRYRLYEIDRIVNRALLYGSLSAILAGVFTAGIALAQRLFIAVTGERSDAAIVLTTLVVATAYAPLRKRLEVVVDRRFKYERGSFGAYRDEVTRFLAIADPAPAAARLAREAELELHATGAAVLSERGAVTASSGIWPASEAVRIAIPGGRGSFAAIVAGPRTDGAPHDPAQLAALSELAALVIRAARLDPPERR